MLNSIASPLFCGCNNKKISYFLAMKQHKIAVSKELVTNYVYSKRKDIAKFLIFQLYCYKLLRILELYFALFLLTARFMIVQIMSIAIKIATDNTTRVVNFS